MKKFKKVERQLIEESAAEIATLNKTNLKKYVAEIEKDVADKIDTVRAFKVVLRLAKKKLRQLDKAKKSVKHVK